MVDFEKRTPERSTHTEQVASPEHATPARNMAHRGREPGGEQHGSGSRNRLQISAPVISLPKGGGAIRGIGEKFSVNPNTGIASLTVPLFTSPGREGFGPQLSLSYNSGSGNGPFGFGWSLGLPAITRKTDKGLPRYLEGDNADVYLISGAEDLVPLLDASGQRQALPRTLSGISYTIHLSRPRIEGLFARLERWVEVGRLRGAHLPALQTRAALPPFSR